MGPVSNLENLEICLSGKRDVIVLCDRDLGLKQFEHLNKNYSN
jgi:hypothetical protein